MANGIVMAQGTLVLINQFDSNGNFDFTNEPDPNWPQGFYRLQLP